MSYKPVDTAITMVVGVCIDNTDFKTIEEAIAYDAAGMDISLIIEKTDGTTTVTPITLTTGGTSDWTHKDGGYYEIEITAAQNCEEGIGYLRGVCTGVLPFESQRYNIVKANIYDSWIKGTDKLEIDITSISGDPTAANNLESDYNGTGYNKSNSIIGTTTTNTDMVGTNNANTVVPDIAGTAATPAEVATALTNIHLDHLLAVDYDPGSKPGVATALLNELVESDGGISRYTANALEQAPTGGENPNVLVNTTIASVIDQTHFTLTAGSNDDDTYNNQSIVLYDASNSDYPSIQVVSDYVGSTKTVTIDTTPIFTIVAGDGTKVFVTAPGTVAPTVGQIRIEMEDTGHNLAAILADTNELQTNQGNWVTATGFNTVIPDAAGVVPTVTEIRQEMDTNSIKMAPSQILNDYKATGFSTHSVSDIWSSVTRSLTDKSGFSLSTAGIKAIWDQLTNALTTVGSLGKLIVDNINTTISSRSPSSEYDIEMARIDVDVSSRNAITPNTVVPDIAGTAATLHGITNGKIDTIQNDVTTIKSKTDNLPSGITKNEALPKFDILMVLSSNHISGATGKTITGEISKDGGSFTAITNVISEVSNGMYTIADGFTQTEMNADVITLKFDGDDCDTRIITILTT